MGLEAAIAENNALKAEVNILKQQVEYMQKLLFGPKSEKSKLVIPDPNQLSLFAHLEELNGQVADNVIETTEQGKKVTKKRKNHVGRQVLPPHLPTEEILIEPDQDTTGLVKIGEQITETLEYTPAKLIKRRYIRSKYAKKNGEGIIIAPMPDRALPKSIAESGLLTQIVVSKFVEHMPFYRQIERFKRDYQVDIPSSTINSWFVSTCSLLEPLYNKLKEKVLDTDYLQADESPIKVLDTKKNGQSHKGYQWVYHNPLAKLILFDYRKGRGVNGPKELLADYQGVLQCDGYGVYDKIGTKPGITLAGCLVHARRKFVDAKSSDAARSKIAIDIFAEIYRHEAEAKTKTDRKQYRDKNILPLMTKLRSWIDKDAIKVLPKSPIGKAMTYTVNQWPKLINAVLDPRVELDNNLIENKIRPLALGRKNYLFAGSQDGAKRIAMMYSFFASCKANDINPTDWMKSTLDRIGSHSISKIEMLLPSNFFWTP